MATSVPELSTATTSPPPSPLPEAPEDLSPGARATALQNAFAKALEATLNKCSYDNFAACFPTPAQYRPQTLEMFHKDFTGRLSEVCTVRATPVVSRAPRILTIADGVRIHNEGSQRRCIIELA
jgi:kinetochore protein NNF1